MALYYQADIRYALNDYETAQKIANEALVLQETEEDHSEMIATLRLLAQIAVRKDSYEIAHKYCERSQYLCELLQNDEERAITLYAQSFIYRNQGNFTQAIDTIQQSLPIFQKLGLQRIEGMAHYQLGAAMKETDSHSDAIKHLLISINIFRRIQDDLGLAYSLIILGDLYRQQNLSNEAKRAWQEALAHGESYEQVWIQEQTMQRLNQNLG